MTLRPNYLFNLVMLATCLAGSNTVVAETQLYETGPSEETSYVRFVNATDHAITIASSNSAAKVELNVKAAGRVSRFYPVKSGSKLSATMQSGEMKGTSVVTGKPWEYITIAVLAKDGKQLETSIVRETPDDFNAMRSSLALFNLDAKCSAALLQGGAKKATILDGVQPFSVQRRLVNPVKLTTTVSCAGRATGVALDLSQLQAGERYSLFLMTSNHAQQAFFIRDSN